MEELILQTLKLYIIKRMKEYKEELDNTDENIFKARYNFIDGKYNEAKSIIKFIDKLDNEVKSGYKGE